MHRRLLWTMVTSLLQHVAYAAIFVWLVTLTECTHIYYFTQCWCKSYVFSSRSGINKIGNLTSSIFYGNWTWKKKMTACFIQAFDLFPYLFCFFRKVLIHLSLKKCEAPRERKQTNDLLYKLTEKHSVCIHFILKCKQNPK